MKNWVRQGFSGAFSTDLADNQIHMASKKTQAKVQSPGVRCWEDRKEEDCGFMGRALLHVSLPLKAETVTIVEDAGPVKKFSHKFVRTSGPYRVKILGDDEFGIPYGKDRLFLYWLITNVVRSQSKTVHYTNARKVMESIGLAWGNKNRLWLKGAINRLLHSTVYLDFEDGRVQGIDKDTILRRVVGVLDPNNKRSAYTECYFELSTDFYRELVEENHAIPLDMEVIRRLGDNYGAMDLYIWWNYRLFTEEESGYPYFYVSLGSLKAQFSNSKKMPLAKYKQLLKDRVNEVNSVIKQVYSINPRIEVLAEKLCFPILSPLIDKMEKKQAQKTPAPLPKPNESKNMEITPVIDEKREANTLGTPEIENPEIRAWLERHMGRKKLSTQ